MQTDPNPRPAIENVELRLFKAGTAVTVTNKATGSVNVGKYLGSARGHSGNPDAHIVEIEVDHDTTKPVRTPPVQLRAPGIARCILTDDSHTIAIREVPN
jgi:hypothetical protein